MFALVLTVCATLAGGQEECDAFIVDTYPTNTECLTVMQSHPQRRDDRFLSCVWADPKYFIDRRDGRSVSQILSDLEPKP